LNPYALPCSPRICRWHQGRPGLCGLADSPGCCFGGKQTPRGLLEDRAGANAPTTIHLPPPPLSISPPPIISFWNFGLHDFGEGLWFCGNHPKPSNQISGHGAGGQRPRKRAIAAQRADILKGPRRRARGRRGAGARSCPQSPATPCRPHLARGGNGMETKRTRKK